MASDPVPPGAVRLVLEGDPTPDQVLSTARQMLRLLRGLEREVRRQEGLPRGTPTRWRLRIRGGEIEYRGDEGGTEDGGNGG